MASLSAHLKPTNSDYPSDLTLKLFSQLCLHYYYEHRDGSIVPTRISERGPHRELTPVGSQKPQGKALAGY
jgi:hypothetical protein